MSNQAQCPNCGGYKVYSRQVTLKKVTEIPFENRLKLAGALLGAAIVAVVVGTVIGADWSLWCGGFFAFAWVVGAIMRLSQSKVTQPAGKAYDFECRLCGYEWRWHEGEAWPAVNAKPGLMALGAKKLDEEEERARQLQALTNLISEQQKKK